MQKYRKRIISIALAGCMMLQMPVDASASILPTDVKTASKNCVLVGVRGSYITEATKALARINEIRKEACNKHYINPATGKKLKASDYVPIKWSSELERQARIRAAEASVYQSHMRPNGEDCFSIKPKEDMFTCGEVLAWNYSKTMLQGVEQWYGEKADWVKQNANAVTGHYTAMISPVNTYVGLGTFYTSDTTWPNCTSGRFSSSKGLDTKKAKAVKSCIQKIEVTKISLSSKKSVNIPSKMKKGASKQLRVSSNFVKDGYKASVIRLGSISWKTSSSAVKISSKGVLTAKKTGKVKVTVTYSGAVKGTATKVITIVK